MTSKNNNATIQFLNGISEPVVPEIRLTRSRDGKTGQAFFTFEEPNALSSVKDGEIKGMKMIDEEGELNTREVKARFLNGVPSAIEATYVWKNETDFQRFMRFAQRYAEKNGMGYSEK
ncbi:photosystem II reaction center protein Psb28 [Prochlorococcus marinus]|uniref:photosystem II reaction center protein Psb28 n=1 Tax=Prochlorococcus marinus TaxID=1219 RepID=UPI0022B4F687|nr:photosystem II reaction center protein Psb28 [Prochlorococcus marinus]